MFVHRLLRPDFVGARGNAFTIGEHKPLARADLINDVLSHFECPGSDFTQLTPTMLLVH